MSFILSFSCLVPHTLYSEDQTTDLVYRILPKDHSQGRTLMVCGERIFDKDKQKYKLVGTAQDVSLLTSYAENLHTAEVLSSFGVVVAVLICVKEFVKAIVSHVEAGIMAINAQGELTLVNRTAREMHGLRGDLEAIPKIESLLTCLRGSLLSRLSTTFHHFFFVNLADLWILQSNLSRRCRRPACSSS